MTALTIAFGGLAAFLGAAVAFLILISHHHAQRIVRLEDENVELVEKCLTLDNQRQRTEAENKVIRDENDTLRNDVEVLRAENSAWCRQAVGGAS